MSEVQRDAGADVGSTPSSTSQPPSSKSPSRTGDAPRVEGLPPADARLEIARLEALPPREDHLGPELGVRVHLVAREAPDFREALSLKTRCVEGERIVAESSTFHAPDLDELLPGESDSRDLDHHHIGVERMPERCELTFALGPVSVPAPEDLGTFCWEDQVFSPGRCPQPVPAAPASGGGTVQSTHWSYAPWKTRYSTDPSAAFVLETALFLREPPSKDKHVFMVVSCESEGRREVDTTAPVASSSLQPNLAGETVVLSARLFATEGSALRTRGDRCDIRLVELNTEGDARRTRVLERHCLHEARVRDGSCDRDPPAGPLRHATAANADVDLRAVLEPVGAKIRMYFIGDVSVSSRIVDSRLEAEVSCKIGDERHTTLLPFLGVQLSQLEPSETGWIQSFPLRRLDRKPDHCRVVVTAQPRASDDDPVELATLCFAGETRTDC